MNNQVMSFQRDSVGFDCWVARVPRATNIVRSKAIQKFQWFADSQDDTKEVFLSASAKTLIQRIIGIFVYYGIALDLSMLVAPGTLATQQSKPTESLSNEITWFLNYAASHTDAISFFSSQRHDPKYC